MNEPWFPEDYREVTAIDAAMNPSENYWMIGNEYDPQILIEGFDIRAGGSCVALEYGSTGEKIVDADYKVFAQRNKE